MLRTELVAKLAAENPNLTRSDAEKVVSTIFDVIVRHLEEGGRVEFRGFGAFSVRKRDRALWAAPKRDRSTPTSASQK